MNLNDNAAELCDRMAEAAERLRVAVHRYPAGCRVIDCGVNAPGGLEAGLKVAEVSMAGLGQVDLSGGASDGWRMPGVTVWTDHPVAACMASQCAGWQIAVEGYFAMGSGPMRALAVKEALFESIGPWERSGRAVGVLETSHLPPPEVCQWLATQCGVEPTGLTVLVAPTASQAGTVQVVARSVETALHKLFELGFDLSLVESGFGVAPLPPIAQDDLAAMGRTNDAILYGGEVTLWLRGDKDLIGSIGPRIPSDASDDHGLPFGQIFERSNRDFYSIDPSLFGPAVVSLYHLDSGRSYRFGRVMPDVLQGSFTS